MVKYSEDRPWGKFERFTLNELSTVKIISINPNQKLSLQYHNKREEFWRVLDGLAKITLGDSEFRMYPGGELYIPVKTLHRIESYDKPVSILEISLGEFDEKDIVRFEDVYGRLVKH